MLVGRRLQTLFGLDFLIDRRKADSMWLPRFVAWLLLLLLRLRSGRF
jgi:hypothetical protein